MYFVLCVSDLFHVLPLWQPLDLSWASLRVQAEIIQMAGTGGFGVPASEEIKSSPEFILWGQSKRVVSNKVHPIVGRGLIPR